MRYTLTQIKEAMRKKGYSFFEKGDYNLNIIGIRKVSDQIDNLFDDTLFLAYKVEDRFNVQQFDITTQPGAYYMKNPMNKLGSAILVPGQYKGAYTIGLHQGKYKALTQQNPVTVIRDYDRNAILDFNNGKEDKGLFGINIHRANATGTTKTIDKYSAGCQVFENAEDFAKFLELAEKHNTMYGNNFTYTLVDERALNRAMKRKLVYLLGGIGALSLGLYLYNKNK
jgi:hypothetical protein